MPASSSPPCRIVFQGDSITDAFRKPTEINSAYQMGNGYAFLVAAELGLRYPGRVECINRGISGQRLQDLVVRWDADAVALRPDVLSLLMGVNSTICHFLGEKEISPAEYTALYRQLLQRLRSENPKIVFILVEPFLLLAGSVTKEWQEHLAVRQAVVREIAAEFGAGFVPAQSCFDEALQLAPADYWAYDGIHPTHAGFALLAEAWLKAAVPLLACSIS